MLQKRIVLLDAIINTTPTQASQLIFESVRILPRIKAATAATATKIAVQAPWVETALRPMEILSIPDPATKM